MYLCQGGSCKIPTIPCLSGYFLITNIKNSQILCSWTIYPLLYNASLLPCMKVMTVNDSYQALSTLPGGEWWQCMKQLIRIRVFVAARHSFSVTFCSSVTLTIGKARQRRHSTIVVATSWGWAVPSSGSCWLRSHWGLLTKPYNMTLLDRECSNIKSSELHSL